MEANTEIIVLPKVTVQSEVSNGAYVAIKPVISMITSNCYFS